MTTRASRFLAQLQRELAAEVATHPPRRTITLSLAEFRADMPAAHRLVDSHTSVRVVAEDGSSHCWFGSPCSACADRDFDAGFVSGKPAPLTAEQLAYGMQVAARLASGATDGDRKTRARALMLDVAGPDPLAEPLAGDVRGHQQRYDDALQMASYESGQPEPRGNVISTALICAALACAFYGALYWLVAL
jgi:hypothetical protein